MYLFISMIIKIHGLKVQLVVNWREPEVHTSMCSLSNLKSSKQTDANTSNVDAINQIACRPLIKGTTCLIQLFSHMQ